MSDQQAQELTPEERELVRIAGEAGESTTIRALTRRHGHPFLLLSLLVYPSDPTRRRREQEEEAA